MNWDLYSFGPILKLAPWPWFMLNKPSVQTMVSSDNSEKAVTLLTGKGKIAIFENDNIYLFQTGCNFISQQVFCYFSVFVIIR